MSGTLFLPNAMKILSLEVADALSSAQYGPACEGFVDSIKSFFTKDPVKLRVQMIKDEKYKSYTLLDKGLEKDLHNTYYNPGWTDKVLASNSGVTKQPLLAEANLNGVALSKPLEILAAAKAMLVIVKEIAAREKPFIEFRKNLIKRVQEITDAKQLDNIWEANSKQLSETAVDRYLKKYKKSFPALGISPQKQDWPVNYKNAKASEFTVYASFETDGTIELPTPATARDYADALLGLFDIAMQLTEIANETYIPYWDILEVEYDELEFGDEIFSYLCSDQSTKEVSDLAEGMEYTLSPIICGLYIAMFDKHLVAKPAVEGWVDRVKNVFNPKQQSDPPAKYDGTKAIGRVRGFLANPAEYRLSGKSFSADDKLYLSMYGKPPVLQSLPAAYEKTIKDAAKLSSVFAKDTVSQINMISPVIERFEKTVIDAMDEQGNLEQDVLDRAMLAVTAAIPKAKQSYYFTFAASSKQCDGYVGGNPFDFKQVKNGFTHEYTELTPSAVPAAKDIETVRKLAEAFMNSSDKNHPWFKEDLFVDIDDLWANFNFDRPVRHLWEMMSEDQATAIGYIYSEEDNTSGLNSKLQQDMALVYTSMLKYLNDTIVPL